MTRQRNALADLAEFIEFCGDKDRRWKALFKRLEIPEHLSFHEKFEAAALQLIFEQPEFSKARRGRPKKSGLDIDELRAHFVEVFDKFLPGWGTKTAIQMGRKLEPSLFPLRADRTIENSITRGRRKLARLRSWRTNK